MALLLGLLLGCCTEIARERKKLAFVTQMYDLPTARGAAVLMHSLRWHKTVDRIVWWPNKTEADEPALALLSTKMASLGIRVRRIIPLRVPEKVFDQAKKGKASKWAHNFNKLLLWNLCTEGYTSVAWLDADTVALKNIDHLFGFVHGERMLAARKGCCGSIINAGVLVLKPSAWMFQRLVAFLNSKAFLSLSNTSLEQTLLERFFVRDNSKATKSEGVLVWLPNAYNYFVWSALKCKQPSWTRDDEQARSNALVVHFTASAGWLDSRRQLILKDPIKSKALISRSRQPCTYLFYSAWAASWHDFEESSNNKEVEATGGRKERTQKLKQRLPKLRFRGREARG